MRRLIFQVHLWTALLAGLYVLAVFGSGAALVYRIELQRTLDPQLFTPRTAGPLAEPADVMDAVSRAYPQHRLSGVDAPTTSRPTYLAYVTSGNAFATVLIDPVSAAVLGELPERSIVRVLQGIHANLLAGPTGRTVHGIGAAAVLVLCISGVLIWRPAAPRARRGTRRLHRTLGIWTVLMTTMWAATGLYFLYPSQVRAAVGRISPLTPRRPPQSRADLSEPALTAAQWRAAIEQARRHAPDRYVARVVLPSSPRGAILVLFAASRPTPTGPNALTPVYLDRFTLERLPDDVAPQTAGDRIMKWITPLHVGNFAGGAGKAVWVLLGCAPPILFVTGFVMWWSRVVRPRRDSR